MTFFDECSNSELLAMSPAELAELIESDPSKGRLVSELRRRMSERFVEIYESEFGMCRQTRKHAATLLDAPADPASTEAALTYLQGRADIVFHSRRKAARLILLFAIRPEVRYMRRIRRIASKLGICGPKSKHDQDIDTAYFKLSAAGNALEGLMSQPSTSLGRMCSHYIAAESHARYAATSVSMEAFRGYEVACDSFRNMFYEALKAASDAFPTRNPPIVGRPLLVASHS